MKTTMTQKLMGLALSLLSVTSFGQCAQITGMNTTLGANGTASVNPVIGAPGTSTFTNYYWQVSGGATQTSSTWSQQGTFEFPANGTYLVCLMFNDSTAMCTSNQYCDSVTITNMSPTACQANFTAYTDSGCVTHFVNASSGSNLTYQWSIDGNVYTTTDASVSLPNGNYTVYLHTFSAGVFCDSVFQTVNVNCGSNPGSGCQASYSYYRDSSCVTHFINTSTGSNLTYSWNIDGTTYTSANPVVNLGSGYHTVILRTFSNNVFCDSTGGSNSYLVTSCSTLPSLCTVNSQFTVFADSTNAGNYFAYNNSTASGPMSVLWDFGDGSTSTQVYPFHQYAAPGHYIICLTVTATTGTVTCSDTYCDSSSVHRMSSGFLMGQFQVIPQTVTSVKDQDIIKGLKAFPNPMADELSIEIELNSANHAISYQLVDALGKVIAKNNLTDSKTTVNTSALDKGFYFLRITNEKGETLKTTKLVK